MENFFLKHKYILLALFIIIILSAVLTTAVYAKAAESSLEEIKTSANAEIEKYSEKFNFLNYSKEKRDKINGYVKDGKTAVNDSPTAEEVSAAIDNAKKTMDMEKPDFTVYNIAFLSAALLCFALAIAQFKKSK